MSHWFRTDREFTDQKIMYYESSRDHGMDGFGQGPGFFELHTAVASNGATRQALYCIYEEGTIAGDDAQLSYGSMLADHHSGGVQIWQHATITWVRGGQMRMFLNGEQVRSTPLYNNATSFETAFRTIGSSPAKGPSPQDRSWEGDIDEVRVSSEVKSDAWIAAEHSNMRNPGAWVTVGPAVPAS